MMGRGNQLGHCEMAKSWFSKVERIFTQQPTTHQHVHDLHHKHNLRDVISSSILPPGFYSKHVQKPKLLSEMSRKKHFLKNPEVLPLLCAFDFMICLVHVPLKFTFSWIIISTFRLLFLNDFFGELFKILLFIWFNGLLNLWRGVMLLCCLMRNWPFQI